MFACTLTVYRLVPTCFFSILVRHEIAMSQDFELRIHQEWLDLLQSVGLVVSPPVFLTAQVFPDKNIIPEQQKLISLLSDENEQLQRSVSFTTLVTSIFGWHKNDLQVPPEELSVFVREFDETLHPTFAVPEPDGGWLLLVQEWEEGINFDTVPPEKEKHWPASPQIRMERLLHETGIGIGLLFNGRELRLIYAPRGETSGHITWPLLLMTTMSDRLILSALKMMLGAPRLFLLPSKQRLPFLLRESRKYQNFISTELAEQALVALNELLRGFRAADEMSRGTLLGPLMREDPGHVYDGILAVLLRLVFLLYAEERGMLSSSPLYLQNYSLSGLFEKLRIDERRNPDTMDARYGAWSRLLVLFRMIHDGAQCGDFHLLPRYGHLFDPDSWSFLEGRPYRTLRQADQMISVPKVPDGTVYRILEKLMILKGERLSYRTLDVEQIGSVYENMMGFRVESAAETSIGIGPHHVIIGLDTLLSKEGAERGKWLKEQSRVELTGKSAEALKTASTKEDLLAAMARKISPLTPELIYPGELFLQPTDERRRSGSHYTPRELTEPIVRSTLRPILEGLGESPKPEQILALKVCDPAMGSGAFLVEACRQLADVLVQSYKAYGFPSDVPPDEDGVLYARRQVAQHCLYGVDKNPWAVDLGKLSLWLTTLARDHAFTFVDHSLRHGDSLVGLTREQIASFHWAPEKQVSKIHTSIEQAINQAIQLRKEIAVLADSDDTSKKQRLLRDADDALAKVRQIGDALVAAFFSSEKAKNREKKRKYLEAKVQAWLLGEETNEELRNTIEEVAVPSLHWEIEFPEVFLSPQGGFDIILGNPPFLNAIEARTGRSKAASSYFSLSYPTFAQGSYDLCLLFWARATTSLLSKRGRYGIISPLILLGARAPWQEWMHQNWRPDALRVYPVDQFEGAAIRVAAIIGGRGVSAHCNIFLKDSSGATSERRIQWSPTVGNWYSALAEKPDHSIRPGDYGKYPQIQLSKLFEIKAGCSTGVAYELSPLVQDQEQPESVDHLKLITTGAIDRYQCLWGKSQTRYLKHDYKYPRWPAGEDIPVSVRRARDFQRRPKIIVGGLTAVLEAWLDLLGEAAGVVSTWVLTPHSHASLEALTIILNSATFTKKFMKLHGAHSMSGNQTTIKKQALQEMLIPDIFSDPSLVEKLSNFHNRLAKSLDGTIDKEAHLFVAHLYNREQQEAMEDYDYWRARAYKRTQFVEINLEEKTMGALAEIHQKFRCNNQRNPGGSIQL